MDEAKSEAIQKWLTIAQHDLASARKLAQEPEPLLDTAIYHCQQAAEKALKALLVFHDLPFEKTHDLEVLMGLAGSRAAGFSELLDLADLLTPYATAFRYPGEFVEPTPQEFAEALSASEKIVRLVLSVLPAESQLASYNLRNGS